MVLLGAVYAPRAPNGYGALRSCAFRGVPRRRVVAAPAGSSALGVLPVSVALVGFAVGGLLLVALLLVALWPFLRRGGAWRSVSSWGGFPGPAWCLPLWCRGWCRCLLWWLGRPWFPCRVASWALGLLSPWLLASLSRWSWSAWSLCSVGLVPPSVPWGVRGLRAWRGVPLAPGFAP